jgi:hypothetical protein
MRKASHSFGSVYPSRTGQGRGRLQNRKTLPGSQKQSVERGPGVREKARTDHAFRKIIMQQRNINAETAFG